MDGLPVELTIRALGPQGDGIHEGRGLRGSSGRVFVDRAAPGDWVRAKVRRDGQGIARGEIVQIVSPSPVRQAPPCVHYEQCGNCTLQHLQENFYRDWKLRLVREALERQGLRPKIWLPPVFVGRGNRRRVTFTLVRHGNRVVMGYYRRRSQRVGEVDSCLVADPELLALRAAVKAQFTPILRDGAATDIFLQKVNGTIEVMVTGALGVRGNDDPKLAAAVSQLLKTTSVARVSLRGREDQDPVVLGSRGPLLVDFGGLRVGLPPAAFLQATSEGQVALARAVTQALPGSGPFADLFSGCGTFAGPMLGRGAVDAYEVVSAAVRALTQATLVAGSQPALRVFRRDLFRNPLRRDELNRYSAVVFDPPRAGCAEQAAEMASARTGVLIGVSCNPATFARDARILGSGGYRLQSMQVVDQFLWSHHVELVGVFTKRRFTDRKATRVSANLSLRAPGAAGAKHRGRSPVN